MSNYRWKAASAAAGALALASCSGSPTHVRSGVAPATAAAPNEISSAFDLLMQGDEGSARKKLRAILKRDPMNANALLLSDSIARDPKDLLGPQSYPYVVQAGDTIVDLAQRFLGNRLKAYQLLRYNDLKPPAVLSAGQTLRIPGEPVRVEPVRRPEPAAPRLAPVPSVSRPKSAPPKAVTSAANPAAARQLRTAGLAALNQGKVDRAVGLLSRAAHLDPGNALIARDLARAQRIAATVRARK